MGEVVPFTKPRPEPAPEPPAAEAGLSRHTRRADPGARRLAAEQSLPDRIAYGTAAARQSAEQLIATGKVVAARITLAMNLGGHEGPDVDIACGTWEGNPAGDVDGWELAEAAPSREQVGLMAELTGFPPVWFYTPMEPGPLVGRGGEHGLIWMCGPRGCTLVKSDWVDERGVLHYGDDEDERLPRTQVQGALPIPAGPQTPKKPRTPAKKTNPAAQVPLPTAGRMPEHLRAELLAKLPPRKRHP